MEPNQSLAEPDHSVAVLVEEGLVEGGEALDDAVDLVLGREEGRAEVPCP